MELEVKGEKNAEMAGIMVHGRGATAKSIIRVADELNSEAYLIAPQAKTRQWYPDRFTAPIQNNQPQLDESLKTIENCFNELSNMGFNSEDIFLLGFSQGACLVLEYAARNPRNYKAIFGLSGGLIGPLNTNFDHKGDLQKTPVFLGCSDRDPHIPVERVEETENKFKEMNADVEKRLYSGRAHTINEDEIQAINDILNENSS